MRPERAGASSVRDDDVDVALQGWCPEAALVYVRAMLVPSPIEPTARSVFWLTRLPPTMLTRPANAVQVAGALRLNPVSDTSPVPTYDVSPSTAACAHCACAHRRNSSRMNGPPSTRSSLRTRRWRGAPFVSLGTGLQEDRAAVEAALTLPWSNGPTEGVVPRIKLVKRQGYGVPSWTSYAVA